MVGTTEKVLQLIISFHSIYDASFYFHEQKSIFKRWRMVKEINNLYNCIIMFLFIHLSKLLKRGLFLYYIKIGPLSVLFKVAQIVNILAQDFDKL